MVTPESFEKARRDMEEICAHAARVASLNNTDWNGPDYLMIADLNHVIDDTIEACRRMREVLNQSLVDVLPIEKSIPF